MNNFHLAIIYGWLIVLTLLIASDWMGRHKILGFLFVVALLVGAIALCGGFQPDEKEGDTSIDNARAMIVNGAVDENCQKVVEGFHIIRKNEDYDTDEEAFTFIFSMILGVGLIGMEEAVDFIESCLEDE